MELRVCCSPNDLSWQFSSVNQMHGTTCRYIAFAHYFTVHMPASVLISTNDDKRSHTRNYSFSIAATLAVWLIKNIVLSRIRTLMWPKCASFQKSAFFLLEPINFHTIFQVILISIRILNLYRHDWFCDFFLLVPIFFSSCNSCSAWLFLFLFIIHLLCHVMSHDLTSIHVLLRYVLLFFLHHSLYPSFSLCHL